MSEMPLLEPELVPAELVPASVGGLATPGAILTRMRLVDADVRAFNEEVKANRARLTTAFENGWAHWRDAWFRFYRENEGFAARMWPGTLSEVEAWARRLPEWRARAQRAGLRLQSPRPARPSPAPRLPSIPTIPSPLAPLRELAEAIPRAIEALPSPAEIVQPARDLIDQSPLSARYWENLKPVAIAGACAVGGLGLLWMLSSMRTAERVSARLVSGAPASSGSGGGDLEKLERLVPMIASRGLIR